MHAYIILINIACMQVLHLLIWKLKQGRKVYKNELYIKAPSSCIWKISKFYPYIYVQRTKKSLLKLWRSWYLSLSEALSVYKL